MISHMTSKLNVKNEQIFLKSFKNVAPSTHHFKAAVRMLFIDMIKKIDICETKLSAVRTSI